MSVEDWAREQAEKEHAELSRADLDGGELVEHWEREAFAGGIVRAFDALLSDEAVEAAAELFYLVQMGDAGKYRTSMYKENWDKMARAALQAAVRAVTDPKTHDSSTTTTGEHTNG